MGVPPINRTGRIQKQIRRAFIASGGRPVLTIDLLEYSYPRVDRFSREQRWRYVAVYRAAAKFGARVGGPGRAVVIWGPNAELSKRLAEDTSPTYD